MLGARLALGKRDLLRWPTHWIVQGTDSANNVQNQTTCYPYMVTRQHKTDHVNEVQGVHKVLHTLKIFISQKPHMVETLHRQ